MCTRCGADSPGETCFVFLVTPADFTQRLAWALFQKDAMPRQTWCTGAGGKVVTHGVLAAEMLRSHAEDTSETSPPRILPTVTFTAFFSFLSQVSFNSSISNMTRHQTCASNEYSPCPSQSDAQIKEEGDVQ